MQAERLKETLEKMMRPSQRREMAIKAVALGCNPYSA